MFSHKETRIMLNDAIKGKSGLTATLICMMISHARGKIHCNRYKSHSGGWRTTHTDTPVKPTKKMIGCYGVYAEHYAAKASILTLDDQAEFIRSNVKREEAFIAMMKRNHEELTRRRAAKGLDAPAWVSPHVDLDENLRALALQIIGDVKEEQQAA